MAWHGMVLSALHCLLACLVDPQGSRPVCAGMVDVYGAELAELVLLATPAQARRQGHAHAAVQQLAGWLAQAGEVALPSFLEAHAHGACMHACMLW